MKVFPETDSTLEKVLSWVFGLSVLALVATLFLAANPTEAAGTVLKFVIGSAAAYIGARKVNKQ